MSGLGAFAKTPMARVGINLEPLPLNIRILVETGRLVKRQEGFLNSLLIVFPGFSLQGMVLV